MVINCDVNCDNVDCDDVDCDDVDCDVDCDLNFDIIRSCKY
jgi:hypothetical protein